MINTYQTSLAPPPVPPRLSGSHPILIPAPVPPRSHSRSLTRFLVGVVLLHLFLSIAGFIFLYHKEQMLSFQLPSGGKKDYISSEKQESSNKALARMVFKMRPNTLVQEPALGYLQWDINHSVLRNIGYYHSSWLTIEHSGDYYVYSRVTFSKGSSEQPLVSRVKLREDVKGEEKVLMQAYCSLDSHSGSALVPRLCTATQVEVIALEKGNQLTVWVEDPSLVNYVERATTFGMYKL